LSKKKKMTNTIYATKSRMTQVFQDGKRLPLTSFQVDSHVVLDHKTAERDGYDSTIIGVGKTKESNKPQSGTLKKLTLDFIPKLVREVKSAMGATSKDTIDLSTILTPGQIVNITALSKGKGFTGVVKRWGFAGGPRTHGQSDRQRAPGSIGRGTTPGRVLKGKKMAGHMGNVNKTVRNLSVHDFDKETGTLRVTGPVPGSTGSLAKITIISKQK
jgi:large subunit ribosomal protein L3